MFIEGMRGGHSARSRANSAGQGATELSAPTVLPSSTAPPAIGSTHTFYVENLSPPSPQTDLESSTASAPAGSSTTCGTTQRKNIETVDRETTYA